MTSLSDEVVVCTRHRPGELAACLRSVAEQLRLPQAVRVVDSSEDGRTSEVVAAAQRGPLRGLVTWEAASPGLTHQRNVAIDRSVTDVIHFLDDDVVLERGYIAAIMAVFESDTREVLGGVGGLITNVDPPTWTRLKAPFGLYSRRQGAVLRSGRNTLVHSANGRIDVDWLSGCSMSYRRSVFECDRFDESLTGYGLGEDVDLSYRIRQRRVLVVEPAARLEHRQSQINRLDPGEYTLDELVSRWRRVRTKTGILRPRAFWWSVAAQCAALGMATIARRPGASSRLRATRQAIAVIVKARHGRGAP